MHRTHEEILVKYEKEQINKDQTYKTIAKKWKNINKALNEKTVGDGLLEILNNIDKDKEKSTDEKLKKEDFNFPFGDDIDNLKMAESQLDKNTKSINDFDKKIQDLTSITNNVKEKVDGEVEEISGLKTDILNIKNDSELKLAESNKLITDKIKNQFQGELSDGEARIQENEQICEELSKEIQELYVKINELDGEANKKIVTYRIKQREYDDLLHQFNLLKESFNDTSNENERLKKTLEERNLQSATLDTEIEDLKQVIAKLTDARVILNRYFSIHYENFTEEEKKLIGEIEGNTFPGYYNNNPVVPDLKIPEEKVENPNKPNIDLAKIAKKNNIEMRNTGKIMNAEEYEDYRGVLRSKAQPQVSSVMQSQNRYNRSYVGPDDDYWYEKKK